MIVDAVVSAVRALFATAMTVVVMDTLIRFGDLIADAVWVQARPNTREVLDGLVAGVLGGDGWGATFLGPLAVLLGMIGMVVTTILLFMRSTLLYLVAAFAPLVWSTLGVADDARRGAPDGASDGGVGAGEAGDRDQPGDRDAADRVGAAASAVTPAMSPGWARC